MRSLALCSLFVSVSSLVGCGQSAGVNVLSTQQSVPGISVADVTSCRMSEEISYYEAVALIEESQSFQQEHGRLEMKFTDGGLSYILITPSGVELAIGRHQEDKDALESLTSTERTIVRNFITEYDQTWPYDELCGEQEPKIEEPLIARK